MSLNYTMLQSPPQWVSAHRECRFTYSMRRHGMVYGGVGGILTLVVTTGFAATLNIGDRVYLHAMGPDERYRGFHLVKDIDGIIITTETPYAGSSFMYEVSLVTLPEVKLYKGYAHNELLLNLYPTGTLNLYSIQPRTLVATFKPEVGINGNIEFDISGYLKAVINEPYRAGYNDTETNYQYRKGTATYYIPLNYAKVEMIIEGTLEGTLYVANAAVSTPELNRFYVNTGCPLAPIVQPAQFTEGINHHDVITGKQQVRVKQ